MTEYPDTNLVQYCCPAPRCGKIYSNRFTLKRHIDITHMKKKQVPCAICHRTFASRQNLKEHLHLHSAQKAFKCSICQRRFKQGSQLSLHKRVHASGGPIDAHSSSDGEEFDQDNFTQEVTVNAIDSSDSTDAGDVHLPLAPILREMMSRKG
jgi:uncharacterized Zn-finger protein